MKKNFRVNCIGLLLLLIFAVFVSFYVNERVENFEFFKYKRSEDSKTSSYKAPKYKSPYSNCSIHNANNCPTDNCVVVTDTKYCAGGGTTRTVKGAKNYNVPSSSYMNSGPATCGPGGYLQKCVTKSLQ